MTPEDPAPTPAQAPTQTWDNVTTADDQGYQVELCRETGEHRHRGIDAWGGMGDWQLGLPPTRTLKRDNVRPRRR